MSVSDDIAAPLAPDQEARVRELASEIAATMIAQALLCFRDSVAEAINTAIVMLPTRHSTDLTGKGQRDRV